MIFQRMFYIWIFNFKTNIWLFKYQTFNKGWGLCHGGIIWYRIVELLYTNIFLLKMYFHYLIIEWGQTTKNFHKSFFMYKTQKKKWVMMIFVIPLIIIKLIFPGNIVYPLKWKLDEWHDVKWKISLSDLITFTLNFNGK